MSTRRHADPIALELVNNSLQSLSDEMGATIARSCASPLIREAQDFAAGYADKAGQVLSNCVASPGFVTSPRAFIGAVIDFFGADIKAGDIFIVNDPYHGGSHLPDIQMVKPVFVEGALFCWIYTKAHHVDVGGRVAGSMAFDNVDIFQDGFRIPPVKAYQEGVPNRTFFDLLRLNIRYPEVLLSDLNAKINAMMVGERGVLRLVTEYGGARLSVIFEDLLNYAEDLARAQIRTWKKGSWEFTDYMDEDMVTGRPLKLHVKVTVNEDSIHADFTGTAAQVPASYNMAYHELEGCMVNNIRACLDGPVPMNSGLLRTVSVYAPEGTVVNPRSPAGTSERGMLTGFVRTLLLGAMVQCRPEKMTAAGHGGSSLVRLGGKNARGRDVYLFDRVGPGAMGARMRKDGLDGAGGGTIESVEILEAHFPVRVENHELVPNTGGPGQFRGGCGVRRDYVWLGTDGYFRPRIPRIANGPWGVENGQPGACASLFLNPESGNSILDPKGITRISPGDVMKVTLAGGGGWGRPLQRDPEQCLNDLIEGLETADHIRRTYGVVIDEASMRVDAVATAQLREQLRQRQRETERAS